MSWPAFICDLCAYIFVWVLSMSYMEHYILCASMFMCIVALCALGGLSAGIPPVSVSAQFMSCFPGDDQGARGILPTVCAYSFSVCRIQISQGCITRLCGSWAKVAYLHFIYNLCALHDYECNQIVFILSTSKSIFLLSTS